VILVRGLALIGRTWQRVNIAISDVGYIVKIWRSDYTNRYMLSRIEAIYNAKECLILPGLIDIHVHFREPGEEHKEDFSTGTKAALASGVVVIGDMPNNKLPVDNLERFCEKLQIATRSSYTDFFLYLMLTNPNRISETIRKFGSVPVKVYLYDRRTLALLKKELPKEAIYVFHAEHPDMVSDHREAHDAYELDKIRPIEAELRGVDIALRFAREGGYKVHITHVSSSEAIRKILDARGSGVRVTFDVTPHHIIFFLEKVDPKSPLYKVLPPIRRREINTGLLRMLAKGLVDVIATDHAPHSPDEKCGDFSEAPPGISCVQYLLPLLYSISKRMHIDFRMLIKMVTENPARIFMIPRRGRIKVGFLADLVIFDHRRKWVIDPDFALSKAKLTPYNSLVVRGEVVATFLRGRLVYEEGNFLKRIGNYVFAK